MLSIFPFIFAYPIYASNQSRDLYYPSGKILSIQYMPMPYQFSKEIVKNISVVSGILNGTGAAFNINFDTGVGKLSFISQDSAQLSAPETTIKVNGDPKGETASIINGDTVIISWQAPLIEPLFPINAIFGLMGLATLFVGPIYCLFQIKKKRDYIYIVYMIIVFAIAYAFLSCWLVPF